MSAGALALTFRRFRMAEPLVRERATAARGRASRRWRRGTPPRRPLGARALALLPRLTWLAFRETVKNVYFLVILLAGVLFVISPPG